MVSPNFLVLSGFFMARAAVLLAPNSSMDLVATPTLGAQGWEGFGWKGFARQVHVPMREGNGNKIYPPRSFNIAPLKSMVGRRVSY